MENRDNGQKSSFRYLFVLYIVLFLLALPLSVLAIPNLKANLEETRFLEHYALWKDKESAKDVRSVKVVLSSYSGLVESERTIHTGYRDLLHYTLEAVLLSETVEEKAKGFISLIPRHHTYWSCGQGRNTFCNTILPVSLMPRPSRSLRAD